jgi:hypothetical protein
MKPHYLSKSTFILTLLFFSLLQTSLGQKIDEEKEGIKDPSNTICTTWESFYQSAGWKGVIRMLKTGEQHQMEVKIFYTSGEEICIDKGQEITFTFLDESSSTIQASENGETCEGCGSEGMLGKNKPGVNAMYGIPGEVWGEMNSKEITQMKILLRTGSLTIDLTGIKSGFAANIQKAVQLIEEQ